MIYRRKITLTAGVTETVTVYGRFLRLLAGTGDIAATVTYRGGMNIDFDALTGVGMDLRHEQTGEGFIGLAFVSATTQVIDILATVNESTDSRLVGDLNLNGTMNVINQVATTRSVGRPSYLATTATQILPLDGNRLKTLISFSTDVYIGLDNTVSAANGRFWPANQVWIDENQGAMWVYSAGAGNGDFIQDRK